jgi:hypothetical protein
MDRDVSPPFSLSAAQQEKDAVAPNPFFTEYNTPFKTPPFPLIMIEHYVPAFRKAMEEQKLEIDALVNTPQPPTFQNTIEAFGRSGGLLEKVNAVFGSLRAANTTDDLQKIANEVTPLLSKHRDDIKLNEKLFQRVKAVYVQKKSMRLTPEHAVDPGDCGPLPEPVLCTYLQQRVLCWILQLHLGRSARSGRVSGIQGKRALRSGNRKIVSRKHS